MWKSITSYLGFCVRTVREDYQNWTWHQGVNTTFKFVRKIDRLVVVLAAGGIIFFTLRFAYEHIFPLLGIKSWAIIGLSLAGIFLVYLTTAIRRSSERMMGKIEANYNKAICEWEKCVYNSADFSGVVASARELFLHLNGGSRESDEHMLQRWIGDAERILELRKGREAVIELRGGSNIPVPIPASHQERVALLNRYAMKFGELIGENRIPKAPYDIVRRPIKSGAQSGT